MASTPAQKAAQQKYQAKVKQIKQKVGNIKSPVSYEKMMREDMAMDRKKRR